MMHADTAERHHGYQGRILPGVGDRVRGEGRREHERIDSTVMLSY